MLITIMALVLVTLLFFGINEVVRGMVIGVLLADLTSLLVIWLLIFDVDRQREQEGYTEDDYVRWMMEREEKRQQRRKLRKEKLKNKLILHKQIEKTERGIQK